MTRLRLWLALFVLSATLTHCSKCKENVEPSLPPETQSGAGTFACRINGVVWQYKNPTGFLNLQERTNWRYDPNEKNGTLSISGYRYDDNSNGLDQLGLRTDSLSINQVAYVDTISQRLFIGYFNYQKLKPNECAYYYSDNSVDKSKNFYRKGKLEITKLDNQGRIISGRFNCTIYQTGCDTLKITDGRFDLKF
jgi:hypothetical protein